MAFLFQKKLVCFYCGCKSAQARAPNVRRWQCTHCEAENYLDENGEITDPPADDVSSNARYANLIVRPTSPAPRARDDPLFCPTCLKNQHLVSQALASYLPPPDAPDYAEYEKAEEEYLKGLEERYPQVCERCEPRVQERIRAAGYAAKTDHLRRLMDRTRGHGIQYRDTSWGSPLVTLGGVGWFLSLIGQLLWDGLSLFESTEQRHGLRNAQDSTSGSVCLQQVMRVSGSISDCTKLVYSAAGLALLLGILSSWWNPMLHETLRRKGVRIVGAVEFYKLQGTLLMIRCATWMFFPPQARHELDAQKNKAAHLSLLIFAAIINFKSFRSVRMDHSAPVKFQKSPASLVAQVTQQTAPGRGMTGLGHIPERSNQSITRHDGGIRPFSIMDLAPPDQRRLPVYQPPTPPPDDDDNEAMDWTPSQENKVLRPATSYRTLNTVSQQPQPISYREKLPANGLSQSISIRNPPSQPVFPKASERNWEYLKTPKRYAMRDSSDESPFATPYEPSIASGGLDLSPVKFAQPRFFPPGDREDLGLESLMANNFSLAEEPHEVRARQRWGVHNNETQANLEDVNAQWHGPMALFLLAISCAILISTPLPIFAAFRSEFRLAALCTAALVILKSLLLAVRRGSGRSAGDIVLLTFELITTMIFGATLRHRAATTALEESDGPLETPGMILIVALIAQEAWMLYSGTWARRISIEDSASPPVPSPAAAPDEIERQESSTGSGMSLSKHDPPTGMGTGSHAQFPSATSQRTTRSRMQLEDDARAQVGFSGLSLGGNGRNENALGMNSLNLRQPQRRNGNGIW